LLGELYLPEFDPVQYKEDLNKWNSQIISSIPRRTSHNNDRSLDRKLKIGFVTPDMKEHPVCRFIICLLKNLDRAKHEVFLYHDTPRFDATTLLVKPLADHWIETPGLNDEQLDRLIQDHRIDILFDLSAHTGNNRLTVFARKPAPVQITWLAYCGTTGLDAIDYRLSDRLMDPPGLFDDQYCEKTVYLTRSFWCYQPPDGVPDVVCPAFPPVFCCLNNFCKMNTPLLSAFAEILRRTQGSSLLLHAEEGSHRARVLQIFAQQGVDSSRIRFTRRTGILPYFEQYNQCHIALDSFPFNGGTTSCDAMWMGVPVISKVSTDRAMGRAGKTLLENMGLSEFLAQTPQEYIDIAVNLASNPERIVQLKQTLRERMRQSPLMDGLGFATEFGSILRQLWNNWLNHDPR
jgi:predicted O-linked N-acetylglucosamine transferase (SPINDLY family)